LQGDDAQDVRVRLENRYAVRANRIRQLRLGELDRVLYVDRCEILTARHIERDRDRRRSVARVRRRVVQHSLQARELFLDWRGHRLRRVLRRRARIIRLDPHCGGRDLRVSRDRQSLIANSPSSVITIEITDPRTGRRMKK
jgi:hypothetical protein